MNLRRFNELLDGPLSHPLVPFKLLRLIHCLSYVVDATGLEGQAALERFCAEQRQMDLLKAGEAPDTD